MKNIKTLLLGTIVGLSSLSAYAQAPQLLPAASPAASVSQTFGLTKVDISYSSPGVKGRQIWGGLLPYDSVWRTGANTATDITFSTDVTIGGQAIKKGKYALFTIPGRNNWTIIINSDADQWGAFDYKKSLDVARFTVAPQSADFKERLAFLIDPVSDSVGKVTLYWEKLKVSFDVKANTKELIQKGFDKFSDNTWRNYANTANYYVDNNYDLKKAHDLAQASINLKEDFYNCYIMAKVLHAEGNNKEALKYATESKTLGDKDPKDLFYSAYKDRITSLIAELGGNKK